MELIMPNRPEKIQKRLQKLLEAQQRYREKFLEKQKNKIIDTEALKEKRKKYIEKAQEKRLEKIKSGEYKLNKISERRARFFEKDKAFYLRIWNERPHYCANCGAYLGEDFYNPINPDQPINLYRYAHILPKTKYKYIRHLNENLILLCYRCHSKLDNGQNPQEMEIFKRIYHTGYADSLIQINKYLEEHNIEKYV